MLKKECFHHQCLSYRKGLIITIGGLTLTRSIICDGGFVQDPSWSSIHPGLIGPNHGHQPNCRDTPTREPTCRNSDHLSSWSQKNCIRTHRITHWKDNSRWQFHLHILHMLKLSRPAGGTTLLMLFEKVSQKPENDYSHIVDPERRAVDIGQRASCICALYGVYLLLFLCDFVTSFLLYWLNKAKMIYVLSL